MERKLANNPPTGISHRWRKTLMRSTSSMTRLIALSLCIAPPFALRAQAQNPDLAKSGADKDEKLKFVVMVSRHGVRSPTGKPGQLNQYSAQPWPTWSVPPGYLTEHGA